MDSQCARGTGVQTSNYGLCDKMEPVLHGATQEPPHIHGFPGLAKMGRAQWCTGELKVRGIQNKQKSKFSDGARSQGAKLNIVQYLGIAADEPERIKRHSKPGVVLPLVDIGWDEAYCRQWCEDNDLLSPIYTTATRGGCWFCHNQGIGQLRLLRKNYPELWSLLLKWDADSPVTFHPDGRTVADFDKRFQMEDEGKLIAGDRRFRWKQVIPEEQKDDENDRRNSDGGKALQE